jgi:uracil-DNA glycosylase
MNVKIEESWKKALSAEFDSIYFERLASFVRSAYAKGTVYPPAKNIFEAFNRTPFDKVKVVILGQDPYHEPNQAHGLCFSVQDGVRLPPSLVNIYKELETEYGTPFLNRNGDLSHWAEQGVLLLNTVLTVERGSANSHKDFGWQTFTDAVMRATASLPQPIACVLWGGQAQKKEPLLRAADPRLILSGPHPSPLSSYRDFFGSKPFSQINEFLQTHGEVPIDWAR